MTDICFIETMAWYIEAPYLNGYYPTSVQAHYNVCDHYGCPSVNVGWALYEQVLAGTPWEDLAADRVHPTAAGSQIYADAITAYLETQRTGGGAGAAHAMPTPLTDYPVTGSIITGFAPINPLPAGWVARYNMYGASSFIESSTPGAQISVPFFGTAAALKVVGGPDGGDASLSVDGGGFYPANIIDISQYIVWALPAAKMHTYSNHTLTIRVDSATVRLINIESPISDPGGPGPDDVNLCLTAAASSADTIYGASWGPEKALDGQLGTKWTSTGISPTHWLAVDLGAIADVSAIIVRHASAGGEWETYNTQAFTIESGPGTSGPWTTEFVGSNPNQLGVSTFSYPDPAALRYVRLNISDPGIDNYARIPEFEVWGVIPPAVGDIDLDGDVDLADFGRFQACYTGAGHAQNDPQCLSSRLDGDTDVDPEDFTIFQSCITGANVPADPDCGR
jgi:hypothetical protein